EGISVMTFEGTISDNIVRNNSGDGIGLHLRTKATINSNIIEMNGKSGIQVWDETVRASFEANTIRNNQWYGIWVESLENVIVCRLNRVEGNEMGDYAVGPCYPLPPPSEELRQMCEGGG
ncbi:MAG: right-handed parallel beta-helix repeat-containing protein, partial [Candidatus Bipolaricaulia bacterium]